MRKFIYKTLWFLLPFIALNIFTYKFYSRTESPDLLRLGYIIDVFPDYHAVFSKEYQNKIHYSLLSDNPKNRKFKALTIGDSFSEQFGYGYKNYLARDEGNKILHVDRFLSNNQIQTLYNLLNGDFFEKYHFEYVILQGVERHFIDNIENIDPKKAITSKELSTLAKLKPKPETENFSFKFPSNSILKFPYYTFRYYSERTFLFDKLVYKTGLSRNLFSVGNNDLLFYHYDLVAVKKNNIEKNVLKLNTILNDLDNLLRKKNVRLIVLPSPDKYDIYYNDIADKTNFQKPLFFDHLKKMPKDYIYIDSKTILTAALSQKKDIYFYDDTHWSPWASQLIAAALKKQMQAGN